MQIHAIIFGETIGEGTELTATWIVPHVAPMLEDVHMALISIRRVNIIGGFYHLLCFMNS